MVSAPPAQVSAPTPGAPAAQGQLSATDSFVAKVLATTEDSWTQIFAASGQKYPAPTLVLFQGSVRSACGGASSPTASPTAAQTNASAG
jgi:predicted metalloprotease